MSGVDAHRDFSQLVRSLAPHLKAAGLAQRRGWRFSATSAEGNAAIAQFQKSRRSGPDQVSFTVDLGVYSKRLGDFYRGLTYGHGSSSRPDVYDAHLQRRIGHLLDPPADVWWTIKEPADVAKVSTELRPLLVDVAVPWVLSRISDEKLLELFVEDPGESNEFVRLRHASVLLDAVGARDRARSVIRRLAEICSMHPDSQEVLNEHLKKLRSNPATAGCS